MPCSLAGVPECAGWVDRASRWGTYVGSEDPTRRRLGRARTSVVYLLSPPADTNQHREGQLAGVCFALLYS
jgi:hypothetical protein